MYNRWLNRSNLMKPRNVILLLRHRGNYATLTEETGRQSGLIRLWKTWRPISNVQVNDTTVAWLSRNNFLYLPLWAHAYFSPSMCLSKRSFDAWFSAKRICVSSQVAASNPTQKIEVSICINFVRWLWQGIVNVHVEVRACSVDWVKVKLEC